VQEAHVLEYKSSQGHQKPYPTHHGYGIIDAKDASGFGVKFPTPTTEEDERMG
jgi:hypothetical protein